MKKRIFLGSILVSCLVLSGCGIINSVDNDYYNVAKDVCNNDQKMKNIALYDVRNIGTGNVLYKKNGFYQDKYPQKNIPLGEVCESKLIEAYKNEIKNDNDIVYLYLDDGVISIDDVVFNKLNIIKKEAFKVEYLHLKGHYFYKLKVSLKNKRKIFFYRNTNLEIKNLNTFLSND